MGTRKTYRAEFKRQAIQLATQPDHTVDEIARDLGMLGWPQSLDGSE
ncbi:transposase [Deinococcus cavernae]|uniref:Transposase n=1 Tax=Deinococcus cavernae TaxID=2320857 RepID=A0A418V762_9DEIO|nr:transposase [Deinococcus cavernae]RJF69871.1 transposase [Deinococcus cavernae]RJF71944.1 transposase [Deinococcus cavernae]